ncbi:phosphatidylethanolamine-binding protein 4 isoform X2 [Nelusetta ayraudi]|uniref:phosphatidylethanolamine-binding protein 4 isoform X2 n=1 Tax=Nelusetta ayraudi TaxID=303726 RepID=UPI003F71E3AF
MALLVLLFITSVFSVEPSDFTLTALDSSFCHGKLQVIYPEMDIGECSVIPKGLRKKISTIWEAPQIFFTEASEGSGLKEGKIQGTTLTGYAPPTPPQKCGFHRYQFMLFQQPPETPVTLTEREKSSRGKWNLQAFIKRFHLRKPVATLQFLTQNYHD